MFTLLFSLRDCFRSRAVLQAGILALRQQAQGELFRRRITHGRHTIQTRINKGTGNGFVNSLLFAGLRLILWPSELDAETRKKIEPELAGYGERFNAALARRPDDPVENGERFQTRVGSLCRLANCASRPGRRLGPPQVSEGNLLVQALSISSCDADTRSWALRQHARNPSFMNSSDPWYVRILRGHSCRRPRDFKARST
jgi:hypothetical protein